MDIDLTEITDEDLDTLSVAILTEQERRTNLARIPDQVADLCRTYCDGGGDRAVLEQVVTKEAEDDRANS